jgi:hypothetical protein
VSSAKTSESDSVARECERRESWSGKSGGSRQMAVEGAMVAAWRG